jgi:hypothetical protein
MIKSIGDNYRIYGLIIVKIAKKSLVLDYGLSNATFETPNHAFAQCRNQCTTYILKAHFHFFQMVCKRIYSETNSLGSKFHILRK